MVVVPARWRQVDSRCVSGPPLRWQGGVRVCRRFFMFAARVPLLLLLLWVREVARRIVAARMPPPPRLQLRLAMMPAGPAARA